MKKTMIIILMVCLTAVFSFIVISGTLNSGDSSITLEKKYIDILKASLGNEISMDVSDMQCNTKTCVTSAKIDNVLNINIELPYEKCNTDNSSCKAYTEQELIQKRDEVIAYYLKEKARDLIIAKAEADKDAMITKIDVGKIDIR